VLVLARSLELREMISIIHPRHAIHQSRSQLEMSRIIAIRIRVINKEKEYSHGIFVLVLTDHFFAQLNDFNRVNEPRRSAGEYESLVVVEISRVHLRKNVNLRQSKADDADRRLQRRGRKGYFEALGIEDPMHDLASPVETKRIHEIIGAID
jgi:hypothetical protein